MKKAIIGAIVGALILFIWQFLSFALINFHEPAQGYTEKQNEIMNFLNGLGLEEGGYVLPNHPENASMSEMEALNKEAEGKPWAILQYHKTRGNIQQEMTMNMIRGYLVNVAILLLFCWIIGKMSAPSFGTILLSALATGLIIFFYAPYTNHIWYQTFDIWAHFLDAIASWGLLGLWLGWWLRRGIKPQTASRVGERPAQMVS